MTPSSTEPQERILALDAFRGVTMILMVSEGFGLHELRDHAWAAPLAYQFDHAPWIGMRFWDLIQPFFMFIVGAVMPWSFEKRFAGGESGWPHVLRRAALLLMWGVIARSIRAGRPLLDVINVLGQLAVAYPIAFSVLRLRVPVQLGVALALLAVHAAAYIAFGQPWTVGENLGEWVDRAIFGKNWGGHYATINCLSSAANVIFGVVCGGLIRAGRRNRMWPLALAMILGGVALSPAIPIIKKTWTASFALVSGGLTIVALLGFWWLAERGWKMRLAVVVGANSIFIYLFHEILGPWLAKTAKVLTTWGMAYQLDWLLALNQMVVVAFQLWVCHWLYQRRVFFKL
jgi:predicted acyltransferase